MTTPQYELADPPLDVISAIQFAPRSLRLLVASWDKHVYYYDTSEAPGRLISRFEYRAPILDVCFGEDEDTAFTAGLDCDVRRISLTSGEQTVLSSHISGVKSVRFSQPFKILVSASWDSTLHVHHLSSPSTPPTTIALPNKPFSISLTPTKLVIAMAARNLHIYNLSDLVSENAAQGVEPWQRRESSLKFMTRAVACMPNDAGYASSSIEGRVAVEWFDPSEDSQARKYAFKCHRQSNPEGVDIVYPVNALAFHPKFGTFASGGGDGFVALWDGVAKRRIRQYQKYASSVSSLSFSADGERLAAAISPGFEDGKEGELGEGKIGVFVRTLGEGEAKGKGAK